MMIQRVRCDYRVSKLRSQCPSTLKRRRSMPYRRKSMSIVPTQMWIVRIKGVRDPRRLLLRWRLMSMRSLSKGILSQNCINMILKVI